MPCGGGRIGRAKLRAKAAHLGQKPLTVLDLFSGIGGFSLGLERTGGFKTVAFCEIDPYCRAVLAKHWPEVPCYDDIRTLAYAEGVGCGQGRQGRIVEHGADGEPARTLYDGSIDVVCGGFPCQDISTAGKGAGIAGERSSLWVEMCRIIGEVRPRFAIVENVAALLGRGLGTVLGDLASIGYDAEWHCIPASAVGAPHRRDRIWIVAYPARLQPGRAEQWAIGERVGAGGQSSDVADADQPRLEGWAQAIRPQEEWGGYSGHLGTLIGGKWRNNQWLSEPDVGRVAHGVPSRVDRLRALGNAVVPQIPELIGRALLEAHA